MGRESGESLITTAGKMSHASFHRQRHSITSNTSTHSSKSTTHLPKRPASQQPLFAFDVFIHHLHLNLQSYFKTPLSENPLILGFRLWDFPLVYVPLPTASTSPIVLKKGKSCLFHLPSQKSLMTHLASFPLYFFLFQNRTLLGSASVSLHEMRSSNIAKGQSQFLSILSGKFKLYSMEGFETGSIECDFRLRHVVRTASGDAVFQNVQHLGTSQNNDFVVNSLKSFGANDGATNRSTMSTAEHQMRATTGSNATEDTLTNATDTLLESRAQFRNTREVNDILKLVDLYNAKQRDAKAIKETLEYTITDMKQQLTVIERALGGAAKKKKRTKTGTKKRTAVTTARYTTTSSAVSTTAYSRTTSRPSSARPRSAKVSTAKILKSNRLLSSNELPTQQPRPQQHPTTPASKGISKIKIHSTKQKRKPEATPQHQSHFVVGHVGRGTPSAIAQTTTRRLSYSSNSSSSTNSSIADEEDNFAKYSASDFEKDMERVGDKDFMHDSAEFKETKAMDATFTVREAIKPTNPRDSTDSFGVDDEEIVEDEDVTQSQQFEVKEAVQQHKSAPKANTASADEFDLDEEFDLDDFADAAKSSVESIPAAQKPSTDTVQSSGDFVGDDEFDLDDDGLLDDVGDEF